MSSHAVIAELSHIVAREYPPKNVFLCGNPLAEMSKYHKGRTKALEW